MEFSTAKSLILLKKQRNICLMRALHIEEEMLKKQMYMFQLVINNNREKIEKIKQINAVEDQQQNNYSLLREEKVALLTDEVNSSSADLSKIQAKLGDLGEQYAKTLASIETLNAQIPQTTIITNVKMRQDNDTCAKAAMFN
jgi:hypothetical protein